MPHKAIESGYSYIQTHIIHNIHHQMLVGSRNYLVFLALFVVPHSARLVRLFSVNLIIFIGVMTVMNYSNSELVARMYPTWLK